MIRLIILGAPGSGKGSQCKWIKEDYNVPHISTGDILRKNIAEETELGLKAKGFMDRGELVPDELVIDLLKNRLEEADCKENGFLLCANHQGMFDPMVIAATCDNPLAAVLKKELAEIPFLKQVLQCTNSFPMDREDIRQSMTVIQKVTEELKKGRNYLIFPEGTRSRNGNQMLEFHGGTFKCALKAKCPIVPIALVDSFRVLDEKGCKPVKVQIHYLKPIPYEEYKGMKTVELAAMVKGRIGEVLAGESIN